jgi:hypothetical protein
MAMAIPFTIWRVGRKYRSPPAGGEEAQSLGDWMAGELDTQSGRRRAMDAAIEVLLPIAAVTFGMTFLEIVYRIAEASAV